jgi:hypothetical protein
MPAKRIENYALDNMFMYRTRGESTPSQMSFNFVANQKLYESEEAIYRFIVRHSVE